MKTLAFVGAIVVLFFLARGVYSWVQAKIDQPKSKPKRRTRK